MLPVVTGASSSPLAATVAHRGYVFAANDAQLESLQLETAADGTVTLQLHRFGHDHRLVVGQGRWERGEFPLTAGSKEPVAACGAWTSADTFTIQVAEYRQPFVATLKLKFAGDQVTFEQSWNVTFRTRPAVAPLTGTSLRQ